MEPLQANLTRGLQGTGIRPRAEKGGRKVTGHGAESGTQCRLQRQEAKAGGWWVWVMSRWKAIYSGRGGGERVKERGYTRKNYNDQEAVG